MSTLSFIRCVLSANHSRHNKSTAALGKRLCPAHCHSNCLSGHRDCGPVTQLLKASHRSCAADVEDLQRYRYSVTQLPQRTCALKCGCFSLTLGETFTIRLVVIRTATP